MKLTQTISFAMLAISLSIIAPAASEVLCSQLNSSSDVPTIGACTVTTFCGNTNCTATCQGTTPVCVPTSNPSQACTLPVWNGIINFVPQCNDYPAVTGPNNFGTFPGLSADIPATCSSITGGAVLTCPNLLQICNNFAPLDSTPPPSGFTTTTVNEFNTFCEWLRGSLNVQQPPLGLPLPPPYVPPAPAPAPAPAPTPVPPPVATVPANLMVMCNNRSARPACTKTTGKGKNKHTEQLSAPMCPSSPAFCADPTVKDAKKATKYPAYCEGSVATCQQSTSQSTPMTL